MITCRVCQSPINVEGKMHQHVVKCGVCNEATVSYNYLQNGPCFLDPLSGSRSCLRTIHETYFQFLDLAAAVFFFFFLRSHSPKLMFTSFRCLIFPGS